MDITYKTLVNNIKIEPTVANCSNVITHVRCSIVATDGVNTTQVPQTLEFDTTTLDANSFVDMANVTIDMIESWVANTIAPDTMVGIKAMLDMQLAAQAKNKKAAAWVGIGVLPTVAATSNN